MIRERCLSPWGACRKRHLRIRHSKLPGIPKGATFLAVCVRTAYLAAGVCCVLPVWRPWLAACKVFLLPCRTRGACWEIFLLPCRTRSACWEVPDNLAGLAVTPVIFVWGKCPTPAPVGELGNGEGGMTSFSAGACAPVAVSVTDSETYGMGISGRKMAHQRLRGNRVHLMRVATQLLLPEQPPSRLSDDPSKDTFAHGTTCVSAENLRAQTIWISSSQ